VGILSGWRMEGVGGEDRVDPGEDLGMFEIRGKSPRAPPKIFKIYDFEKCLVTPYLLVCFWRENVAEHSTKCATRTPTPN